MDQECDRAVPMTDARLSLLAYKLTCDDGTRYVVYNAAALDNPPDHVPDKWYVRPYAAAEMVDGDVRGPFDSVDEAKQAVRDHFG